MQQRNSRRSPVTRPLFRDIMRDVKIARVSGVKTVDIAKYHNVSAETVRAVRRAGTWPQYERDKQARIQRVIERQSGHPAGRPLVGLVPPAADPLKKKTVTVDLDHYDQLLRERSDAQRLNRALVEENANLKKSQTTTRKLWPFGRR
jgi:hypothetical protein